MPELVMHSGTWNDVRVGDLIDGTSVKALDKKQKFVFITLDLADQVRPWRKALADSITFERNELTADEVTAKRRAFARDLLVDELTKLLTNTPLRQLEKIVAKARNTGGDLGYNVLTWSNLPNVLEAQAMFKVALRITNGINHENLADATYDEFIDAFARWYLSEHGMLNVHANPLSRSSSVISNLLDDLDEWANHEITHKLWYYAIRDDVDTRAAELTRR